MAGSGRKKLKLCPHPRAGKTGGNSLKTNKNLDPAMRYSGPARVATKVFSVAETCPRALPMILIKFSYLLS